MAKPKKSSIKSKVVSGNTKKSVKKLTLRSAVFGLMGILALSVIGGLLYSKWQDSNLSAKAAGYPQVKELKPSKVEGTFNDSSMIISACTTKISGGDRTITAHYLKTKPIANLGAFVATVDKNNSVVRVKQSSKWNSYNATRITVKVLKKDNVKSIRIAVAQGGDVYKIYTLPVANIVAKC